MVSRSFYEKAFMHLKAGDMVEDIYYDLIWEVVESPAFTGILMIRNERFLTPQKFGTDFEIIGAAYGRIKKELENE